MITLSTVAIFCGCRARQKRKRSSKINLLLTKKKFILFSKKTSDGL
jgi:hypothetical protein